MQVRWHLLLLPTLVLLAGCSALGMRSGTEQPSFELVEQLTDDTEIRRYSPRLAAETTVPATSDARNEAFRRLAGYIFGDNRGAQKIAMTSPVAVQSTPQSAATEGSRIAMTAPVATTVGGDALTMRFFLPSALNLATAPLPNDANVRLVEVPAETLAVLRFSGARDDARVNAETTRLLSILKDRDIATTGEPRAFFYDPPWTVPALRRNEVAVPVGNQGVFGSG